MLRGFFTVFVIILVVVFQNDLRRTFERMASWGFRKRKRFSGEQRAVQVLAKAMFDMARMNRGALVVFPGRDLIEHFVEGGQVLDGRLSHPLLMSLFDSSSPGHDGAIVLEGDRITRFAVHLPLSRNFEEIREGGTRHSAALGLSECTDALTVLVSEERGEVSVAHEGQLGRVETAETLEAIVLEHAAGRVWERGTRQGTAIPRYGLEAVGAVGLAVGLWWLSIAGTTVAERTLEVPVRVENIRPENEVAGVSPAAVEVTLQGLGRDLYLLDPTAVEVLLDASATPTGVQHLFVSDRNVTRPENVDVVGILPAAVTVEVRQKDGELPAPTTAPVVGGAGPGGIESAP
jgi:DNA integrity scanning protein DisA with diadenylate cyclase activity